MGQSRNTLVWKLVLGLVLWNVLFIIAYSINTSIVRFASLRPFSEAIRGKTVNVTPHTEEERAQLPSPPLSPTITACPDWSMCNSVTFNAHNTSQWNISLSVIHEIRPNGSTSSVTLPIAAGRLENLLSLFTTMTDSMEKRQIHRNTFKLWSALKPDVTPMLFVCNPTKDEWLVHEAHNEGWLVFTAPVCHNGKLPALKFLFQAVKVIQKSLFYCFANGDMLFEQSLTRTLKTLYGYVSLMPKHLAFGERTNIKVGRNRSVSTPEELRRLAASEGSKGSVAAIDYFLSTSDGFPWSDMPPIVVGRVAYDNWLIAHSKHRKWATLDLTDTVLSVHQIGIGNYQASRRAKDAFVNKNVIGRFEFKQGLISCATHKTTLGDDNQTVVLYHVIKTGFCGAGDWHHPRKKYKTLRAREVLEKVEMP